MPHFECEDCPRTFCNIQGLLIHIDNDHDSKDDEEEGDG